MSGSGVVGISPRFGLTFGPWMPGFVYQVGGRARARCEDFCGKVAAHRAFPVVCPAWVFDFPVRGGKGEKVGHPRPVFYFARGGGKAQSRSAFSKGGGLFSLWGKKTPPV